MHHCFSCPDAVAYIHGSREHPYLSGEVHFYQKGECVLLKARVQGLPSSKTGFYGFHIHEGGSCCGENFADTGSHFDPKGLPHPRHAGDLPPLLGCDGGAYLEVVTDRFCIEDIIGRTIVIHSDPDDFISQPAGNAGKKIACGLIRRK